MKITAARLDDEDRAGLAHAAAVVELGKSEYMRQALRQRAKCELLANTAGTYRACALALMLDAAEVELSLADDAADVDRSCEILAWTSKLGFFYTKILEGHDVREATRRAVGAVPNCVRQRAVQFLGKLN